jgi:4-hydroxy 2-oxovalerate aldolase
MKIIENTLRDGSYTVDFQMTKKDTSSVVKELAEVGFEIIEIGHGLGLGAYNKPEIGLSANNDTDYITAAKEVAGDAKISAFFIPGIGTKEDIKNASECGLDFIRIGININQYEQTREYAEYAKSLGLSVGVNCMKSYALKPYEFNKIARSIDSWKLADVIYLVDSAGCMTPDDIDLYLRKTSEQITTKLGFHGHNNLSLAAINSIQAIKSGATYVDSCIRGMGRSAGNAQTEILIILLQRLGYYKNINVYDLYKIANDVVVPMMVRSQGMTDNEIHIGYSKFHTSYMPYVKQASKKYNIDEKKLIKIVSDINCLDPSEDLFNEIANEI